MQARVRVAFSRSAKQDLLHIVEWCASQGAPDVGRRLVSQVIERTEPLRSFPDSGRMVPEFATPWLREVEMPPFRIIYRRDEAVVTVVRVWRSERVMDSKSGGNA